MKWLMFVAGFMLFCFAKVEAQSILSGANNSFLLTSRARQTKWAAPRPMSIQGLQNVDTASVFPNIDVTNDPAEDQCGPSISVNPIDPLAIAIGEVDDRSLNVLWYYASTNGGHSWNSGPLPAGSYDNGKSTFGEATDPGVVYDQEGTLFFSNVFEEKFTGPNEEACYKSTDDGKSWQAPVYVGGDTITGYTSTADRDYITVDREASSPFFGRVYIVWVNISYPNSLIVESHSSDHGASWSLPVPVSPASGLFQGPIPACGPNGELYVTYEDRDSMSRKILVARSTDGGSSFGVDTEVSPYRDLGPELPDNFNGHPAIKDSVETNSFPSITVDRSNLHRGRIYITWCGRSADSSAHVFLSTSDDSGNKWATPRFIDNDSNTAKTDKCFPWIAVDESNGDVGVTFYDSRNDPDSNILIDDYLTLSTDGGQTFTARRISNASFDPRVHRDVIWGGLFFFGDYISLDAMDSVWYPTWTDSRSGYDQDIYMSVVQPYAPMPVTNLASHDTTISGKTATVLSWDYNPQTTFGFPLPTGYHFIVSKDTLQLGTQSSGNLSFIDTNNKIGSGYRVTVQSGQFQSIPDSLRNLHDAVAIQNVQTSSIRFLNEPAIVGRQDEIQIETENDCSVSLNFYDELGREIGAAISDGITSSHHELFFTPDRPGVRFFVLKELTSNPSREITGKISVLGY